MGKVGWGTEVGNSSLIPGFTGLNVLKKRFPNEFVRDSLKLQIYEI